eukprot:2199746-Pleurochrysis_carterae.AAC.2
MVAPDQLASSSSVLRVTTRRKDKKCRGDQLYGATKRRIEYSTNKSAALSVELRRGHGGACMMRIEEIRS